MILFNFFHLQKFSRWCWSGEWCSWDGYNCQNKKKLSHLLFLPLPCNFLNQSVLRTTYIFLKRYYLLFSPEMNVPLNSQGTRARVQQMTLKWMKHESEFLLLLDLKHMTKTTTSATSLGYFCVWLVAFSMCIKQCLLTDRTFTCSTHSDSQ